MEKNLIESIYEDNREKDKEQFQSKQAAPTY